jgi:16S rRNA (uracil1498-N3)-methyltransferase
MGERERTLTKRQCEEDSRGDKHATRSAHRPPRFFMNAQSLQHEPILLDASETRHAQVRRLAAGSTVVVFDGAGVSHLAKVERISRRAVELTLLQRLPDRSGESPLDMTLAVALLKADKLDTVIEKATELGVSRVMLFASRYSLGRPSAARLARWRQIAIAAAKQCERTVIPRIEGPLDLTTVLREPASCRLLLWEDGDSGQAADLASISLAPTSLTLLVGPEGGFAADEVAAARTSGWLPITLGPRILRAETAAIAATALCQHLWGDLRSQQPQTISRLPTPDS